MKKIIPQIIIGLISFSIVVIFFDLFLIVAKILLYALAVTFFTSCLFVGITSLIDWFKGKF